MYHYPPSHYSPSRHEILSQLVRRVPNAEEEAEHTKLLPLLWAVIREGLTPETVRSNFKTWLRDEEHKAWPNEAPSFIAFTSGFLRSYGMTAGGATNQMDQVCEELLNDLEGIYNEHRSVGPVVGAGRGTTTATDVRSHLPNGTRPMNPSLMPHAQVHVRSSFTPTSNLGATTFAHHDSRRSRNSSLALVQSQQIPNHIGQSAAPTRSSTPTTYYENGPRPDAHLQFMPAQQFNDHHMAAYTDSEVANSRFPNGNAVSRLQEFVVPAANQVPDYNNAAQNGGRSY